MKYRPTGLCVECAERMGLMLHGINTGSNGKCLTCNKVKVIFNEQRDFIPIKFSKLAEITKHALDGARKINKDAKTRKDENLDLIKMTKDIPATDFITKDSGKRKEMANGFVRDDDGTKLRFDLIPIDMLERLAGLYTRGAVKYGDDNRQKARGDDIKSFKRSARRHLVQRMKGDTDEDHGVAVARNVFAYEHLLAKQNNDKTKTPNI